MPGEYEQLAPIASMAPAGTSRRAFYAKCALMATIATAVVVGSVLVIADRHEAVTDGSELGGAYYAVTKPPAFNFNRECRTEAALRNTHDRLFGSRKSSCSACPYLTGSLCRVVPPLLRMRDAVAASCRNAWTQSLLRVLGCCGSLHSGPRKCGWQR